MKVKINKFYFAIREMKDESELQADKDIVLLGLTNYLKQEIILRSGMSKALLYETLIHELTHAFIFSYGYSNVEAFNHEQICEFVGVYADNIVQIANKYIKGAK